MKLLNQNVQLVTKTFRGGKINKLMPVIDEVSKNCGKGRFIDSRKNIIEYVDIEKQTWYCKAKLTSRINYKNEIENILWKHGPEFKILASPNSSEGT